MRETGAVSRSASRRAWPQRHLAGHGPGQDDAQRGMPVHVLEVHSLVLHRDVLRDLRARSQLSAPRSGPVMAGGLNELQPCISQLWLLTGAALEQGGDALPRDLCSEPHPSRAVPGTSMPGHACRHPCNEQPQPCMPAIVPPPCAVHASGARASRLSTQSNLRPNHCGTVRSAKRSSSVASSMFSAPS